MSYEDERKKRQMDSEIQDLKNRLKTIKEIILINRRMHGVRDVTNEVFNAVMAQMKQII